jgi:hypothetical protein
MLRSTDQIGGDEVTYNRLANPSAYLAMLASLRMQKIIGWSHWDQTWKSHWESQRCGEPKRPDNPSKGLHSPINALLRQQLHEVELHYHQNPTRNGYPLHLESQSKKGERLLRP